MNSLSNSLDRIAATAVALGKFDGLHRAHRRVIEPILSRTRAGESINLHPTVVTFTPHPQAFFTGKPYPLLTPSAEKIGQLLGWGVEQVVQLPFNQELADLSPRDFVERILVRQLKARMISVGEDFCFGKQRAGTAGDLRSIAATFEIPVIIVPTMTCQGERISSSSIRQALLSGDLPLVRQQLGHPYCLAGTVISRRRSSQAPGFLTLQLKLPADKFLPCPGLYGVQVHFQGKMLDTVAELDHFLSPSIGVMSVSDREVDRSIEVYLAHESGDLIGKTLSVQLEDFWGLAAESNSLESWRAHGYTDRILVTLP
jgi:riboflavin kinase / FMN adenylyltransferase